MLDSFVDNLARRLACFDRETLGALKTLVNRVGMAEAEAFEASNQAFFAALAQPAAQARRERLGTLGYGVRSDLELNFGRP